MKQIRRKLLDSLICLERLYWETGNADILPGAISIAMEISEESNVEWLSIKDFATSIVINNGLSKDASNEKIYEVLNVLGWEVVDEIKESESL